MDDSMPTTLATAPIQKRRRLENGSVVTAFVAPLPAVRNTPTSSAPSVPSSFHRDVLNVSSGLFDGLPETHTGQVEHATPVDSALSSAGCSSLIPSRAPQPSGVPVSYAALDAATHGFRLAQVQQDHESKGTGTSYNRHIRHYVEFWDNYQAECHCKDPTHVFIPTFPVTAAKVAMFLQHESTREKVGAHRSSFATL